MKPKFLYLLEPGLLEELQTRVEAAEQKFKAAELDDHLSEFEVARQRQVIIHIQKKKKKRKVNVLSYLV